MSAFDLARSLDRAEQRLGSGKIPGRRRQDRGRSRLDPELLGRLSDLLQGQERPPVRAIMTALRTFCRERGLRAPARATVYQAMEQLPSSSYRIAQLPAPVRETLYNLAEDGDVPGHQLAFYCLNYGDSRAVSFAAGLPWLALYQAARMPGWRARSRGLLEAIRRVRGI